MKQLSSQDAGYLESKVDISELSDHINIYKVTTKINANCIVDHILDMEELLETTGLNTVKPSSANNTTQQSSNTNKQANINDSTNNSDNTSTNANITTLTTDKQSSNSKKLTITNNQSEHKINQLANLYGLLVIDQDHPILSDSLDSIKQICQGGVIVYTKNFSQDNPNGLKVLHKFVAQHTQFRLYAYDLKIISEQSLEQTKVLEQEIIKSRNNNLRKLHYLSAVYNFGLVCLRNLVELETKHINKDDKQHSSEQNFIINLSPTTIYHQSLIAQGFKFLVNNKNLSIVEFNSVNLSTNLIKDPSANTSSQAFCVSKSNLMTYIKSLFTSNKLKHSLQLVTTKYSNSFICRLENLDSYFTNLKVDERNQNNLSSRTQAIFKKDALISENKFIDGINYNYLLASCNLSRKSQKNKAIAFKTVTKVLSYQEVYDNQFKGYNNNLYNVISTSDELITFFSIPNISKFYEKITNNLDSYHMQSISTINSDNEFNYDSSLFVVNHILNNQDTNLGYKLLEEIILNPGLDIN